MMEAGTFALVPIEVLTDKRLTLEQTRVLIALFSFRGKNTDTIWPSRAAISERTGMHISNISNATKGLVDLGWLSKSGLGGYSKSTRYTITVPRLETVAHSATVADQTTVAHSATQTVADSARGVVADSARGKEHTKEHTSEQTIVCTPKKAQKRNSRYPDDFAPNETAIDLADSLGLGVATELLKFEDYHRAKGTTMLDWQAAFRTWLRNAAKFAPKPTTQQQPYRTAQQRANAALLAGRDIDPFANPFCSIEGEVVR